jgi:acetyl-CoA acetyltransferase family protein
MRPPEGREVVIVQAVRTPIGRGHPRVGVYRHVHPNHLLGCCYTELLSRAGVDPAEVENVIAGCVHQFGEQGYNIARNAWLEQGLPIETAAATVDLQCGSAQLAVGLSAALIATGVHEVMIGAGVEHMGHLPFAAAIQTQTEFGSPLTPELLARHEIVGQGLGAELIAAEWEISRSELDAFALRSHRLAHAATQDGRFDREIVPITVPADPAPAGGTATRAGGGDAPDTQVVCVDQGIRPDTSLAALAALKPAFELDGRITAGNASQISDGAAAVLLMSAERARGLGLRARARIVDQTTVGCDPVKMLEGPIPATAKILRRQGISIDDVDLIEINEAFASVVLAWAREHRPDMDRVNVNGGAIALGHPLGSTGARLITTLLHELERADKELGLVTMCCGGGLGTATLIQRL